MTDWRTISLRDKYFTVHGFEDISNAIVRDNDFYEHEILDYLAENYPIHKRIIDVGANIGNHTVFFSRFLKYDSIVAFEPDFENYAILTKNLRLNEAKNVHPVNAALGNYNGTINLFLNNRNFGMHQVMNEPGGKPVPIYTLDISGFDDVTLIKIDVEYYEPQVLEGAKETIERCHPLILIEDVDLKYADILEGYKLLQAFPHYRTYLYG